MFELKVTFEAGESIKALVSGLITPTLKVEPKVETPKKEIADQPKEEKPKTPKVEKPKSEPKPQKEAPAFADLDDDAKLEAIKAEVTKQTKNKKGADIKWMLAQFNASSVSKIEPLEPEDYDAFFDAITRYGKGDALTDIFPSELD